MCKVGLTESICGCRRHNKLCLLEIDLAASVANLNSFLFGAESDVFRHVYSDCGLVHVESDFQKLHWPALGESINQRTLELDFQIDDILYGTNRIRIEIFQSVTSINPERSLVVDEIWALHDFPGGVSLATIRYCLSQFGGDRSILTVTGDFKPPGKSLFPQLVCKLFMSLFAKYSRGLLNQLRSFSEKIPIRGLQTGERNVLMVKGLINDACSDSPTPNNRTQPTFLKAIPISLAFVGIFLGIYVMTKPRGHRLEITSDFNPIFPDGDTLIERYDSITKSYLENIKNIVLEDQKATEMKFEKIVKMLQSSD